MRTVYIIKALSLGCSGLTKAYVRMQIEQLFFQAEFGGFTGSATENFGSTPHQPSGRANDHYQGGSSYLML